MIIKFCRRYSCSCSWQSIARSLSDLAIHQQWVNEWDSPMTDCWRLTEWLHVHLPVVHCKQMIDRLSSFHRICQAWFDIIELNWIRLIFNDQKTFKCSKMQRLPSWRIRTGINYPESAFLFTSRRDLQSAEASFPSALSSAERRLWVAFLKVFCGLISIMKVHSVHFQSQIC